MLKETISNDVAAGPAVMHDKQSERDHRELRIDKVGVRGQIGRAHV